MLDLLSRVPDDETLVRKCYINYRLLNNKYNITKIIKTKHGPKEIDTVVVIEILLYSSWTAES